MFMKHALRLFGSLLAASAFAFAKADFEQWARDNPDATEVEIRSQAELLASRAGADVYSKARDKMKRPASLPRQQVSRRRWR